jgi:hypothetical protein
MAIKSSALFPCGVFFARGQVGMGIVTLLMQITIVLWPVAASMAGKTSSAENVDSVLAQLSETHKVPMGHIKPKKTFSQSA